MKNRTVPAPTPTGPQETPEDGHRSGITSRGHPISFDVTDSGTFLRNFKIKTDFDFGACEGWIETSFPGPYSIINRNFSGGTPNINFTGKFSSPNTATGTYAYINYYIWGCNAYLNQSGTRNASIP